MQIESCEDDPSANCELYNAAALCDPNGVYYTWARSSCPGSCGLCRGSPLFLTLNQKRHSFYLYIL